MGKERPRLFIVGADDEALQDLHDLVGDRFIIAGEAPESASALTPDGAKWLLATIGEGVALLGSDGARKWANGYYDALDEAIHDRIARACRQSAAVVGHAQTGPRPDGDTPPPEPTFKFEVVSADQTRFFDVFLTLSSFGGDAAFAVLVRDVTQRRLTQRKMDAIDRAGHELARFDAEQLRSLNPIQRLQLLERDIKRTTSELLAYDHFAIFLLDRKRRKLQLVISEGLPETIQDLDLYTDEEGSGISGYVAATGQSYICYDASSDEKYLPGLVGARSSLTVPLKVRDEVIGILDVESREPGQFNEQDRQFTEIFARHIALALHMLDLLVAERCEVNETVSGRFRGELSAPLEDLDHEIEWLDEVARRDPAAAAHVDRIRRDIESIRERMRCAADGPQTLLGVEQELHDRTTERIFDGRRILVADDQPKIRKIIGDILTHRGAKVDVCAGGEAAIATLKSLQDDERFDLVISDIHMPDRNGYEVFSASRRACPAAPVILMTGFGYDPHHSIVRASQEGLSGVLFKPFEVELLIKQVHDALEPEHAAG